MAASEHKESQQIAAAQNRYLEHWQRIDIKRLSCVSLFHTFLKHLKFATHQQTLRYNHWIAVKIICNINIVRFGVWSEIAAVRKANRIRAL